MFENVEPVFSLVVVRCPGISNAKNRSNIDVIVSIKQQRCGYLYQYHPRPVISPTPTLCYMFLSETWSQVLWYIDIDRSYMGMIFMIEIELYIDLKPCDSPMYSKFSIIMIIITTAK